jgi:hypothetical protein
MTTVHGEVVGDRVVLPREQLDRLVSLARQVEPVDLNLSQEEVPTIALMILAEQGGAFDWLAQDDDLYTLGDLKVRYR